MVDVLDKLIVSETEATDINLLASIIEPYLKIIKEKGEIVFNRTFINLRTGRKY